MKRPHSHNSIRKKKQQQKQPTPKKRRLSYFADHLLIFEIDQSFSVKSKKKEYDCFICSLEYLKIIDPQTAETLRAFIEEEHRGVTVNQMLNILKLKLKKDDINDELVPYESIQYIFDLLKPSTATIIGLLESTGDTGHIVLLAKDSYGRVGIVDPQASYMCMHQECDKYMKPYTQQPIIIFTSKH